MHALGKFNSYLVSNSFVFTYYCPHMHSVHVTMATVIFRNSREKNKSDATSLNQSLNPDSSQKTLFSSLLYLLFACLYRFLETR